MLEKIRNTPIDIVLADYRLRDNATGWSAIKQVREFLGIKLPAIIITGDTSADRIREASQADAHIMYKPIAPAQLKSTMTSLLKT